MNSFNFIPAQDLKPGNWIAEQGGAIFQITKVEEVSPKFCEVTIDARGWISLGGDYKILRFKKSTKVYASE